jgi:GAF domain-containing protein/HAMP domain-containing protein
MNIKSTTSLFKRLLSRTGGYFILIVVTLAQIATYLFTVPVSLFIRLNAEFKNEDFTQLWIATIISMLLALASLLVYTFLSNRQAFSRLQDAIKVTPLPVNATQEMQAWKQISALPWQYARSSMLITILIGFTPMLLFEAFFLRLSTDQIIYTAIGVLISSLSIITLGMIAIEGMITPARQLLLPKDYDAQLAGTSSLRILPRLNLIILTLLTIAILLVAPIGYRFTFLALQSPHQPNLLLSYQAQSLGFSLLAILLGAGLAWMLSQSVSIPLTNLVNVFQKVEKGDLSQIAPVISSDEIGELTVFFNRMLARVSNLQNKLEEQVTERTAQLSAVNEVGRAVSAILDPDELIEKVANLITDRFGHYYSAIFLVESTGKWAELKSATGEAGRVLRESHHRLSLDGKSMVGTAISQKQARIALDIGAESVRFDNPLLPYTHSEIALPLIAGERVLGALDVQSTKQSAFGESDIETLQNMASQVAVALENARLFQETRQRLQELQTVQRQYLQEAWTSLSAQKNLEYGIGDDAATITAIALNVPLTLRDQIIGQIRLEGDAEWSPEERTWVEAVATQTSIALENARLMEESRDQASIERTVAEITARVWSANTIDSILQTAAKEIGRALNLSEATIALEAEEQGASKNE